jgi:ribosomal protein S18 acetylase RimI-like enzyme
MTDDQTIKLEPAKPEDFDYFYDLRHKTMLEHFQGAGKVWDDAELGRHRLSFNPNTLRMIHYLGQRVGFVDISPRGDDIRISLFCIEPDHQNRGIGTEVTHRIIRAAEGRRQNIIRDVLNGNRAARLYERLGFQRVEGEVEILDYYKRPPCRSIQPMKKAEPS